MAVLSVFGSAAAQTVGLTRHEGDVKDSYNYWLYSPKETVTNIEVDEFDIDPETGDSVAIVETGVLLKPLIVFLHGASLCGHNLDRVRTYGTIDAIERGRDLDAYVIAPQNPGGSWQPAKVMKIVDHVMATCPIDSTRLYVVGMSLGGYGTIDMVATYPDRIAAAMAFCGGGTVSDYSGLNQVPLWIVHGTADRAVGISQSDAVVNQMKKSDKDTPRLIYDRVPGWNHGSPARLLYLQDSYDWLMKHSLDDDNREVATNSIIGSNLIKNAYQGLKNVQRPKATKKKSRGRKKTAKRRKRRRR